MAVRVQVVQAVQQSGERFERLELFERRVSFVVNDSLVLKMSLFLRMFVDAVMEHRHAVGVD